MDKSRRILQNNAAFWAGRASKNSFKSSGAYPHLAFLHRRQVTSLTKSKFRVAQRVSFYSVLFILGGLPWVPNIRFSSTQQLWWLALDSTMGPLSVDIMHRFLQLLLKHLRNVPTWAYVAGGIIGWMALVRALRWRRYNAIHREFGPKWDNGRGSITPEEAQKIILQPILYDMPLLLNYALAFALFKTYAVVSARLLNVSSAVSDFWTTLIVIHQWFMTAEHFQTVVCNDSVEVEGHNFEAVC